MLNEIGDAIMADYTDTECRRLDPAIQRGASAETAGRKHLRVNAYKRIKRLESQLDRAADLVGLLQRRSKRAARTPSQKAVVYGGPLMRLLDRVVQTDQTYPTTNSRSSQRPLRRNSSSNVNGSLNASSH